MAGEEVERSFEYKWNVGWLPDFARSFVDAHTGVGFDCFVSMDDGMRCSGAWPPTPIRAFTLLQDLCRVKTAELMHLPNYVYPKPSASRDKNFPCIVC